MVFDHGNKIPLGKTAECRFAEMWIMGNIIISTDIVIGEIAAPATGHQDFLASLVGVIDHQHIAATFTRFAGTHQASCTGTDNQYING